MDTFKTGDTVRLKSGGPLMTIRDVNDGYAVATWFDTKQQHHEETFAIDQIEEDDGIPAIG